MSGDLISLHMVAVAATRPDAELLRQGAGMASVPIDFSAVDAASAASALAKGGVDIVILDVGVPAADCAAVIKAARAVTPAPFVVITAPSAGTRVEGTDATVAKPANIDDARKLAELCIRVKIPTRALVVDDSGTMRSIVRKILSGSRFALEVQEAEEGIAALAQLRTGNFGIVFLDYNMPGLNGFETLSEIKREIPGVAVVMMTSTLDNAIADRAHASGALAFLKKPFYPKDIDAVLERFYGLHVAPR
jgi:CheY-like chemotaxis protein